VRVLDILSSLQLSPSHLGKCQHPARLTDGPQPGKTSERVCTFLCCEVEMSSRHRAGDGLGTALSGWDRASQAPGHAVLWPGLLEQSPCKEWRLTLCSKQSWGSVFGTQLCPAVPRVTVGDVHPLPSSSADQGATHHKCWGPFRDSRPLE
jgi:hypothetical protein